MDGLELEYGILSINGQSELSHFIDCSKPGLFTCTLCGKSLTVKCRLRQHLEKLHWHHRVEFASSGVASVLCKCDTADQHGRHWHCPFCLKPVVRKNNVKKHAARCGEKNVGEQMASQQSTRTEEAGTYYPPDMEGKQRMMAYWMSNKLIPYDLPAKFRKPKPARIRNKTVEPVENTCTLCNASLSEPVRITEDAVLLTTDTLFRGYSTYCRQCTECGIFFRYQEHVEGIFNFNDHWLTSNDYLLSLREHVNVHIPVESEVRALSRLHGYNVPSGLLPSVLQMYEALTDRQFDFCCLLCGYQPAIIRTDLQRKACFRLNVEKLSLPPETEEHDTVDADEFWKQIRNEKLASGLLREGEENDLAVQPNFQWAPFIGRQCRNNVVVNTEHRKVIRGTSNVELEAEVRQATEEQMLEMLYSAEVSVNKVEDLCTKYSIAPVGSKADMIGSICKAVGKSNRLFNKVFSDIVGASGGLLSASCPHGVVYGLKFCLRAESPRDHVDIIRSLSHQPPVCINDMPLMIAKAANERYPGMFHPQEGCLLEPSQENIDAAKAGKLSVELKWLDLTSRPITGGGNVSIYRSAPKMCLYDDLHERNTRKEAEILRRVSFSPQLRKLVNTQVPEELLSKSFLNMMTPSTHINMFRNIIDSQNIQINKVLRSKVASLLKGREPHLDKFGRLLARAANVEVDCGGIEDDVMDDDTENSDARGDLGQDITMNEEEGERIVQEKFGKNHPQVLDIFEKDYTGLINQANACWLNSTLQVLNIILSDVSSVLEVCQERIITPHAAREQGGAVLCEMAQLLNQIRAGPRPPVNPDDLLRLLANHSEIQRFAYGEQHDCHDVLSLFLNELQTRSLFEAVQVRWLSHCLGQCDMERAATTENLCSIGTYPVRRSVVGCLERMTEEWSEPLLEDNAVFCETCNGKEGVVQKLSILTTPQILVLHLLRFTSVKTRSGAFIPKKDSKRVELSRYLFVNGVKYRLVVVQCHDGCLTRGHYVTVVVEDDRVVELSDVQITAHPITYLASRKLETTAYVLYYDQGKDESDGQSTDNGIEPAAKAGNNPEASKEDDCWSNWRMSPRMRGCNRCGTEYLVQEGLLEEPGMPLRFYSEDSGFCSIDCEKS